MSYYLLWRLVMPGYLLGLTMNEMSPGVNNWVVTNIVTHKSPFGSALGLQRIIGVWPLLLRWLIPEPGVGW